MARGAFQSNAFFGGAFLTDILELATVRTIVVSANVAVVVVSDSSTTIAVVASATTALAVASSTATEVSPNVNTAEVDPVFYIMQGETTPDMQVTLYSNGTAYTLENTDTVEMRWRKPDGTVSTVPLSIVTAASGIVARSWDAGDTDLVGAHKAQITVTRSGVPRTFPNDGSYVLWQVSDYL